MSDETIVRRLPGTEGKDRIWQPVLDGELDVPLRTEQAARCGHKHVAITSDRLVMCRDCERYIDPVDYILGLASEWDWYKRSHRDARLEIRQLGEQVAALKRQEKNTKARLRKLEPEAFKRARLAVDKARSAVWRTEQALRELGIKDGDALFTRLLTASSMLRSADEGLDAEEAS